MTSLQNGLILRTTTEPVWVPVTTFFPSGENAQLNTPSVPEEEAALQQNT